MPDKHSILIIEDSRELVDLLYRRFEGTYNLSYALDGEEGLALASSLKPDLVLMDVNLPSKSGFNILKELRASDISNQTAVIMMTSNSDTDSVVQGFSLGADDYVVKPFNFIELSARVKAHLTIKDLQRELMGVERLKALREVAVSFNHEINNPLMSINAFAYYLKGALGNADAPVARSVEGIITEVERVSDIVKKLSAATNAASVEYGPGINMIDFGHLTETEEG